jgi:hypothetical protein
LIEYVDKILIVPTAADVLRYHHGKFAAALVARDGPFA